MALVDLALGETALVVPEQEFRQICDDLMFTEDKFFDLLRVVMLAYADASPQGVENFRSIERWIRENYINLRDRLPDDLKRLYLTNIAFPVR